MRLVSLNRRTAIDAQASEDVEVLLAIFEHPDLAEPLRISTDRADRISLEPLTYGTWSTFGSNDGEPRPFYYVNASILMPDDEQGTDATSSIVLDVLESDIVEVLTSTTTKATCRIASVMSSSPNLLDDEIGDLELQSASGDWGTIAVTFSAEHLLDEPYPALTFSKQIAPGLHK